MIGGEEWLEGLKVREIIVICGSQVWMEIRCFHAVNLLFFIDMGSEKKMNVRKNGYGDNFSYDRKRPWTH